ncbi:MAG TPA: hypothetical protein VE781_11470, partial [Kineosporiaceae bacterium]|nr:hypothetical protein [Kineosporiaceae bacterium]
PDDDQPDDDQPDDDQPDDDQPDDDQPGGDTDDDSDPVDVHLAATLAALDPAVAAPQPPALGTLEWVLRSGTTHTYAPPAATPARLDTTMSDVPAYLAGRRHHDLARVGVVNDRLRTLARRRRQDTGREHPDRDDGSWTPTLEQPPADTKAPPVPADLAALWAGAGGIPGREPDAEQ